MMSVLPDLSEQDRAVLNSIFNPSLPLGEGVFDNEFQSVEEADEILEDNEIQENIKQLEISAIKLSEAGDYDGSIELFNKCIELTPNRAANYNNRAQVYQLQGNIAACISDLDKCIELTGGKGRVCSQALCQRGILSRRDGNDDEARIHFKAAAKLGNAFAKQQLIELNPYAALCNQMLSQVMQKLK